MKVIGGTLAAGATVYEPWHTAPPDVLHEVLMLYAIRARTERERALTGDFDPDRRAYEDCLVLLTAPRGVSVEVLLAWITQEN